MNTETSRFRRGVDGACALPGCYAVLDCLALEYGTENLSRNVRNYKHTLRKNPDDRRKY